MPENEVLVNVNCWAECPLSHACVSFRQKLNNECHTKLKGQFGSDTTADTRGSFKNRRVVIYKGKNPIYTFSYGIAARNSIHPFEKKN